MLPSFFRSPRQSSSGLRAAVSTSRRPRRARPAALESLEPRHLLSVTPSYSNYVLTFDGDAADDPITIGVNANNFLTLNSASNFYWFPIHVSAVQRLIVNGGGGNDTIDLQALNAQNFPLACPVSGSVVDITGGDGTDEIHGSQCVDQIFGEAGNDTIFGYLGDDVLDGGDGTDSLVGGDDNDSIVGGAGADNLVGGVGNDSLLGDTGNDNIDAGAGTDFIDAGSEDDTIASGADADSIYGGSGADVFTDIGSQDSAYGGEGNDFILITGAINSLSFIAVDAGDDASDQVYLYDASSGAGSLSYNNGTVKLGSSNVATISNAATVTIAVGAGINSVSVLAVQPGVNLEIAGLNSSDTADVGDQNSVTARGLDTILGDLKLTAPDSGGTVAVRLHDEYAPAGRNFAVSVDANGTRIKRPGFGTISAGGFGITSLTLYGGAHNDVVDIPATMSGVATTFDLAGGDDTVSIATAESLTSIAGPLTVTTGAGDDTIQLRYGSRSGSTPELSISSTTGNDTFRIAAPGGTLNLGGVTIADSGGGSTDIDTLDIGDNALAAAGSVGSVTGIEALDASHNLYTTLAFPTGFTATGLKTLDLRYNNINLALASKLTPVTSLANLSSLLLYGNDYPLVEQDSNGKAIVPRLNSLDAIKGKLLRIDLAPLGLCPGSP